MNSNDELKTYLNDFKIRLDAIIMLMIRNEFKNEKGDVNIGNAARFLHNFGFNPTEIAILLGKKKASDVSQYLYKKKQSKSKQTKN